MAREEQATATSAVTGNSKTDKIEAVSTPTITPKQDETKTFTCSCGDSYTESIPATGHQWETRTGVIHHESMGHMESTPIERHIFHCDDCGNGGGSFSWITETAYENTWVIDSEAWDETLLKKIPECKSSSLKKSEREDKTYCYCNVDYNDIYCGWLWKRSGKRHCGYEGNSGGSTAGSPGTE